MGTYPGVYIEEIPSGVRTISSVGASVAAFIGRARFGPVNEPVIIHGFGDFERIFGELTYDFTLGYAVQHYFLNGGGEAVIVRITASDARTGLCFMHAPDTVDALLVEGKWPGSWTDSVTLTVDYNTINPSDTNIFNLTFKKYSGTVGSSPLAASEVHYNLSVDPASPRYVVNVLENESDWIRVWSGHAVPPRRPTGTTLGFGYRTGLNGGVPTDANYVGSQSLKTGIYALEKTDLFNMLCIPPIRRGTTGGAGYDIANATWQTALAYCRSRRAVLIVDTPAQWDTVSEVTSGIDGMGLRDENAVFYFPRLIASDAAAGNMPDQFAACGAVAGAIARTDADRGVWKAPAGIDARLVGISAPVVNLTESETGQLNLLGINVIRQVPAAGTVIWGARTLEGADRLASEWKYLPVRRVALLIEESLYRGTQWVVFEPNDESLWAQIRLNVGAFMHQLFRQGAFQGDTPAEAYFVRCDSMTTTQNDVNQGVVNIMVGFAPLKPAEFVVIKIQQMAGQVQS